MLSFGFLIVLEGLDVEIYTKGVIPLIDAYYVLRQLFETEHSLILPPVYLEGAVGYLNMNLRIEQRLKNSNFITSLK